jgi:hypothetical protein
MSLVLLLESGLIQSAWSNLIFQLFERGSDIWTLRNRDFEQSLADPLLDDGNGGPEDPDVATEKLAVLSGQRSSCSVGEAGLPIF